jgi:predicted TIM-barrel fold metal-dependent hydrolase
MRFFDTHLHLPTPDVAGVETFLEFVGSEPGLIGGNLILNTPEEVAAVAECIDRLPATIVLVPYLDVEATLPEPFGRSGWRKIHPTLQRIEADRIPTVVDAVRTAAPRGVIVHSFPWGPELRFNVSLALVLAIARAAPETAVLVAHGGGYEAWPFRAHAGGLENVDFDFSMTLDYYEGSDVLAPLGRYLRFSPSRVHFGSDWPHGDVRRQLRELERIAAGSGLDTASLERLLLANARRRWSDAF